MSDKPNRVLCEHGRVAPCPRCDWAITVSAFCWGTAAAIIVALSLYLLLAIPVDCQDYCGSCREGRCPGGCACDPVTRLCVEIPQD